MPPLEEAEPSSRSPQQADPAAGIVCAIPARYASSRLPGKPLLAIAGRPMIEHVYERASRARAVDSVVVLTDDPRIQAAVEDFGGRCEMTPATCRSGTDRIAWAARSWSARAVINVQGDEPLLDPEDIDLLAQRLRDDAGAAMVTLATAADEDDYRNPDAVKVVVDAGGRALYFSRSPIPYRRSAAGAAALRHVGIYGYRIDVLLRLAELEPSPLELAESLEQLRALENGIAIQVLRTRHAGIGVDTEADLRRAERLLQTAAGGSN